VVLDDVLTTGKSKLEAIVPLQAAGLQVKDIVVLVDREQGGARQLADQGYHVHAVLKLSCVLEALARHGRISAEQHARARTWMEGKS
jgi:uridine monophosphate synthetase